MTTIFRINGFQNCNGCSRKVKKALTRFHGVQLINLDRENGNVTVFTAEHPAEVIRYELERKMKKTVVIVSNQNHNSNHVSSILPAQRALDLQGLGEALVGMIHVLDSVEITRSNTLIVKFNHRENSNPPLVGADPRGNKSYGGVRIEEADVEYTPRRPAPPLPVAEPSAPLKATEEEEVYGYPPEYYGFSGSHDHPDEWCRIV